MGHSYRPNGSVLEYRKKKDGYFHGRRPVGRPLLRCEDNIRTESSMLLKVNGCRKLAEGRDIWRRSAVEVRDRCVPLRHFSGLQIRFLVYERRVTD
jgi:hypothetical protein